MMRTSPIIFEELRGAVTTPPTCGRIARRSRFSPRAPFTTGYRHSWLPQLKIRTRPMWFCSAFQPRCLTITPHGDGRCLRTLSEGPWLAICDFRSKDSERQMMIEGPLLLWKQVVNEAMHRMSGNHIADGFGAGGKPLIGDLHRSASVGRCAFVFFVFLSGRESGGFCRHRTHRTHSTAFPWSAPRCRHRNVMIKIAEPNTPANAGGAVSFQEERPGPGIAEFRRSAACRRFMFHNAQQHRPK